jgi:hypothetical protein
MNTNYYNPLGLISDGYLYLNNNNAITRLECKQVRNIYFKKEKVLSNNIRLLILSLLLFTALLLLGKSISYEYKIGGYFIASVIATSALLIRYYNYKIIITTKNQNIIRTNIDLEYKNEARELISHIKQNIKSNKTMLKAI